MTVARILANKGRNVVTVRPEQTLLEISTELMRHGIGAVVVVDVNDSIVGLVSERDIVAAIVSHGPNALFDAVARHMTTNPKVAAEDDTVAYVMETMTLGRRRHLPVVHNGRLTGLVSIGDVVKYRIEAIENDAKGLRDYIATG
jgi:CBS domain-containing protein